MKTFHALFDGFRSTNRSFRVVLLLYVVNFLTAAIVATGFHSVLASTLGDSMSLERLVKDFDYTVYADFMTKDGGRIYALLSQLNWLILFSMLFNTLLGGGTIAALKNEEYGFSLSAFFENCGLYFSRFFRLFLIFGIVLALFFVLFAAIFGMIMSTVATDIVSEVLPFSLAIVFCLLLLFVAMLIIMMADYAKIVTVADDATSMLKTAWNSVKFVFRHFLSTTLLQLAVFVTFALSVLVYLFIEGPIGMSTPVTILVMFLIQQLSVGFKVYTRVWTFAGELQLYKAWEPVFEQPAVEQPVHEASVVPVPPAPSQPVVETEKARRARSTTVRKRVAEKKSAPQRIRRPRKSS